MSAVNFNSYSHKACQVRVSCENQGALKSPSWMQCSSVFSNICRLGNLPPISGSELQILSYKSGVSHGKVNYRTIITWV